MNLREIEEVEAKYLDKYYYFLKFAEDELLEGFKTKNSIRDDWYDKYQSGISDFAVGAERIVYSLLNGKGIGQPNSAPVGSDLFFEVKDAFINIDLKTVGATLNPRLKTHPLGSWSNNIGDYTNSIFVGINQNSYRGNIVVKGVKRPYIPSLPTFYNKGKENEKVCLSYFITILYDKDTLDTLVMSIVCMPNGELVSHYGDRVLKAGKNLDKTRFNYKEVQDFELLANHKKRIKVVYFKEDMDERFLKNLGFYKDLYSIK